MMEDSSLFFSYIKMELPMFDEILNRDGPRIQKSRISFLKDISCLSIKLLILVTHQF